MAVLALARTAGSRRSSRVSGLADVVELDLDTDLVIDAFIRVSLIGIEFSTIDVRVIVSSVDTFLRFAEATQQARPLRRGEARDGPATALANDDRTRRASDREQKTKGFVDTALEKVEQALSPKR